MKTEYSLQDALQIAHLAEGTMHSEELSKQYLDTVKKDAQVDGLNQGKGNQFRSRGHGHGHGQTVEPRTHQSGALPSENLAITARKKVTSPNFARPEHIPNLSSVARRM